MALSSQHFNQKHFHNAPLKGMGPEATQSIDFFVDYFKILAESDADEAGWLPLDVKDWGGKKKKVKEWLEETGVKAECRCANGDGSFDQARIKFIVDVDIETMVTSLASSKNDHSMTVGTFMNVLDRGKDWKQVYRAIRMPWPLRQRDLVYTEHTRREHGGDVLICSRSSKELDDTTNELSVKAGRMRAEMRVAGYRLRPIEDNKIEMVYLVDIDLGGSFAIGYLYR